MTHADRAAELVLGDRNAPMTAAEIVAKWPNASAAYIREHASDLATPLCPECARANVIATQGGPTCRHQEPHGAEWWPAWWQDAGTEYRRAEWLELRNNQRRQF
jgi:hypothetical protein